MQTVLKGKAARPRRVLMHASHGFGKSTWASQAPNPIVLTLEDGLDDVGCDRTPLLKDSQEVARWLIELGGEEHEYKTVVLDTIDWLERLIWQSVARDGEKDSIEDYGYGKGYQLAVKKWEMLLNMLDCCRAKGMNVVLLSHSKVERFSPPDAEPYDRWAPDIHKTAAGLIQEWCDEVLFGTKRVSVISRKDSFGKERTRAIGDGERIVHTTEAATHQAKRRIAMPDTIPLAWEAYQKYWPTGNVPTGDIGGIVTNGHSKKKES
jgi:hypothetical protein